MNVDTHPSRNPLLPLAEGLDRFSAGLRHADRAIHAAAEALAQAGIVVLPSHVELKILEATRPTPNGIRVVHGEARLRGLDLQHISGRRWRSAEVSPTRVRVCRGSRR